MSTEPEHLAWLVKRLQHRHHRALDTRLQQSLDVSLVQWNALREIDRHPGDSQRSLAEHTFNSVQAFGTLVARLMERGLVTRVDGQGRATKHELTPKGEALLRAGQQILQEITRTSFAPLSKTERVELRRLLELVLKDGAG
ncbi:MAG TPA: MarR family winged helix-turn-helix transcriptional regulator [Polyangiaceae bacterium]|nr:MarR family winged helix-turn-helix transcriptional regulator [Polyangiaceae bacterium]